MTPLAVSERDRERIERLLAALREELERQPDLISHRLSILWIPSRSAPDELILKPERRRKV